MPWDFLIPLLLVGVVVIFLSRALRIVKQQRVAVVERLGKFQKVLEPGPHLLIPMVDNVRILMDMREEVVPFPPQGVITEDNLMVNIDSVIYFQIVDPVRAAYEAQDYRAAIEQLTMTTLRNIIGGMDLEAALTSREAINEKLRSVLDEATGKWGIKVNRVELRAIEPPATIRDAMEKGARAERDKRAAVLLAEGQRQAQILSAGGERESAILRAQGEREAQVLRAQADRQAKMLRAEGEAQAITTVFNAIHAGQPDQALLSYQYMQMLPSIAKGDANKVWIVPSEINDALKGLGKAFGGELIHGQFPQAKGEFSAPPKVDVMSEINQQTAEEREQTDATVQQVIQEAEKLSAPVAGHRGVQRQADPDAEPTRQLDRAQMPPPAVPAPQTTYERPTYNPPADGQQGFYPAPPPQN